MLGSPEEAEIQPVAEPFPEELEPHREALLPLDREALEWAPVLVRLEPQDPPEQGHRPPF